MKRILSLVWAGSLMVTVFGQGNPATAARYGAAVTAVDPLTGLPLNKAEPEPKFNIDFPGGPPEALVATIEKVSKTHPNIVIHPECRGGDLPEFRLRDVSVSQIFNTLNSLAEPEYREGVWRMVPMPEGEVWTLTKFSSKPVYGGMGVPGMSQAGPPPAPRSCKIYNLSPYLDTFTVEDITTAVQGAWDLMKSEGNPNIKYHKDTKLLIVVGSAADLNVVTDVLQQLMSTLTLNQHKPEPARESKPAQGAEAKPAAKQ